MNSEKDVEGLDKLTMVSIWMKALNGWVVRSENLKKFTVIHEIGRGGQAKVYKISKNRALNGVKNDDIKDENTFAIKIIKKDPLLRGPSADIRQLMSEIRVQRELAQCGNSLKLYKIYETD